MVIKGGLAPKTPIHDSIKTNDNGIREDTPRKNEEKGIMSKM